MRLQPLHRARRFVSSVLPRSISTADREWVTSVLTPLESSAFDRMSVRDQAHAIGVARAVESNIERFDETDRTWVLQAALLHDVGKSAVRLGTYGRVMATLAGWVAADMAPAWSERSGMTRKIGLYLQYPSLGADILRMAEANPRVIAWAEEHHSEAAEWSVPASAAELLVAADDGRL